MTKDAKRNGVSLRKAAGKRKGPRAVQALALGDYLPYLVTRISTKLLKNATPSFSSHGLTVPQWRLLVALWEHENLRPVDIADITSIERPTLSRLLESMRRAGYLRRKRVQADNRSVEISSTEAGRNIVVKTLPWALEVENQALKGMRKSDVRALRRMLKLMYENISSE